MKVLIPIAISLMLISGCEKKVEARVIEVPVTIEKVRKLPSKYLDCKKPNLSQYNPEALTDTQTAEIIYQYDYELNNCFYDIKSIREIQSRL